MTLPIGKQSRRKWPVITAMRTSSYPPHRQKIPRKGFLMP
ncbi:het-domain-containing protein [Colletotrichum asianum]